MTTVLATFSVLKDHVKFKSSEDAVSIDNIVFRLHYRATFLALLVGSLLVSSQQYFGEHIKCIIDKGSLRESAVNTYCFFTSTFTITKHMNATLVELESVPHPGIGPETEGDAKVYHAYYQWVPFVLFFQAILFYLPHYLWRNAEAGRLKKLVSGLHMASLSLLSEDKVEIDGGKTIPSKTDRGDKIERIRMNFLDNLHMNRQWSYYLGLCELFNFINVLSQMYITNWFLDGAFFGIGDLAMQLPDSIRMDPLDTVFPKVTKCLFHKYGPSGTIQKHDALCVMALNIVNEKIYTFLWFWFIILAIITGLGLVWRILTILLYSRSRPFNRILFSMACPGKHNPWSVLTMSNEYQFGDWLFLYYIAKNVDNYVFKDLLEQLGAGIEERKATRFRKLYPTLEQEPLKSA